MLSHDYYHAITKKVIVSFGKIFSDIKISRYNNLNVVEQIIDVPLSYGNREKWYLRLKEEAKIDERVLITLPRIGFEIVGMNYDPSRQLNKFTQYRACLPDTSGNVLSAYVPVPYLITFEVSIMTKTQDDMFQIIEQIIPYFTPQYNITINAIPELSIEQDIPITMTGINLNDSSDGLMETRREIVSTLVFTAKTEYLGWIDKDTNVITKVKTKIDPMYGEIGREVDVSAVGVPFNYTTTEEFFDVPRPIGNYTGN